MNRTYLEEDVALIKKYFPGARTVNLRTPFDLTRSAQPVARLQPDSFHDTDTPNGNWIGDMAWTN